MSTYPLEKLLAMWKSGAISVEQLAGHLLQHLMLLEKRVVPLEKGVKHLVPPQPPKEEEAQQ